MTILELHRILSDAIEAGHGKGTIYFDAEARNFDCHLVKIDRATVETAESVIEITGNGKEAFVMLTTRTH